MASSILRLQWETGCQQQNIHTHAHTHTHHVRVVIFQVVVCFADLQRVHRVMGLGSLLEESTGNLFLQLVCHKCEGTSCTEVLRTFPRAHHTVGPPDPGVLG